MTSYRVTFKDTFQGESEEDCYDQLLKYLQECVKNGDVTAFEFQGVHADKITKGV